MWWGIAFQGNKTRLWGEKSVKELILSNAFSLIIDMIMWYLSFIVLIWYITLIDIQMLKHLQFWSKSHIMWGYNSIYMLLDFIHYFFENFYTYVYKRYWSLDFLWHLLSRSGIRVIQLPGKIWDISSPFPHFSKNI